MTPTLLTLALVLAADADLKDSPRKPHPFAPSLPEHTDEEEERLDRIIDAWILYDSGQLGGEAGRKARSDFQKLGPESIFALIRGLNRAAEIEHSCPVVTIAKKIHALLFASDDLELLEFARENIGIGVKGNRHLAVIKDLRFNSTMRRNTVARLQAANPALKPPRSMSNNELTRATSEARGPRLEQLLSELGRRQGDEVVNALAKAIESADDAGKVTARAALVSSLSRIGDKLEARFKDERAEVRAAAARAAGKPFGNHAIDLLNDPDATVRETAHQVLVRLNRGADLGPAPDASPDDRELAVKRWREWWASQGTR
jgi:hypothetical protein